MIYLVYIPGRCCCLRPADSAHSHCAPPTRPRWGSSSAELRSKSGVRQRRSLSQCVDIISSLPMNSAYSWPSPLAYLPCTMTAVTRVSSSKST